MGNYNCRASKNRNEVLGARVNPYMAAKKWDMVAAVASRLVKIDPQTAGWWMVDTFLLTLQRHRTFVLTPDFHDLETRSTPSSKSIVELAAETRGQCEGQCECLS